MESWFQAFAAHAEALASRDGAALEAVAGNFQAMGSDLWAAEAMGEAAMAYREAGRKGSFIACLSKARELAARCEGARTPALQKVEFGVPLNPRELEVASLAAEGQSSQEIAERLVISLRTVDSNSSALYKDAAFPAALRLAKGSQ